MGHESLERNSVIPSFFCWYVPRFVKNLLNGILAEAGSFYKQQWPGGNGLASLLLASRACVTLRVGGRDKMAFL